MTAALAVEDLKGGPGDREILRGISLSLEKGEVHALMGPNGSGKSTLSHCLMGRPGYRVTGGRVAVQGHDVVDRPVHERARAGLFVSHQYPLEVAGVANRDFLDEVQLAFGTDDDIDEIARRFEVPVDLLDRTLNEGFSGGEKKRNEILQLAVASLVERMTGEGLTVLLITHYTRILNYLAADRVHVMIDGAIVDSGGPELADALEAEGYDRYRAGEGPAVADDPFADPLA